MYTDLDLFEVRIEFLYIVPHGATSPPGPGPPHYRGFKITRIYITFGRNQPVAQTLPDTQHSQQTDILSPRGFEPTIPTSERRSPMPHTTLTLGCICNYYI